MEETTGHKYWVECQATGGFLAVEHPFSKSRYPIDPYYFIQNTLGAGKDKGNVLDENCTYDEVNEEPHDEAEEDDAEEIDESESSSTGTLIEPTPESTIQPSENFALIEPPTDEDGDGYIIPKRSRAGKRKRNLTNANSNKQVEPVSEQECNQGTLPSENNSIEPPIEEIEIIIAPKRSREKRRRNPKVKD